MPSLNMKKKYKVGKTRKQSMTRNSTTSLETASASTTSVRLVTINRSPTSSRKYRDGPPLKLVNFEQELAESRGEAYDDNSVRLMNMAKLPPKYADVFDLPAAKLFNVNKPPPKRGQEKSPSKVNLVTSDDRPITPKEAYDNPTYEFWKRDSCT